MAGEIIEAAELLDYAGGQSDETSLFESYAIAITNAIENYCGRSGLMGYADGEEDLTILPGFMSKDAEEIIDGNNKTYLVVPRRPISSITHIKQKTAADTYETVNSTWYGSIGSDAMAGIIRFESEYGGYFTLGIQNYKIRYIAGYTNSNLPGDLALAMKLWVKYLYEGKNLNSKLSSESLGPQSASTSFSSNAMPDEVKELLRPYRSSGIMGCL